MAAIVLLACGGDKPASTAVPTTPAAATGGPVTPCATCKVINVKMVTTEEGNYYEPKEITADEGDVLRFTLVTGVHNVNFLADSNPGKQNLPPVSDMLQLPGQTKDILLNFGTGRFYFQCDPHALLGMIGHVSVQEKK